jgi:hypothetical protein
MTSPLGASVAWVRAEALVVLEIFDFVAEAELAVQ